MSFWNNMGTNPISLTATAAITRRRFVIAGATARTCTQASAATQVAIGVAEEAAAAAGAEVPVRVLGVVQAEAGAAITAGAQVTTDASGRAIAAATGNNVYGVAQTAAGAAGDTVMVLLALPAATGPTTP